MQSAAPAVPARAFHRPIAPIATAASAAPSAAVNSVVRYQHPPQASPASATVAAGSTAAAVSTSGLQLCGSGGSGLLYSNGGGTFGRRRVRSLSQALQAAAACGAGVSGIRQRSVVAAVSSGAAPQGVDPRGHLGVGAGGAAVLAPSAAELSSPTLQTPPRLDQPTAEIRMSTASERAAATCAFGPRVAARLQADCIRAVRAWCKLGYGDHIVVHVEHQQLACARTPGLLSSAALLFVGPDGRRHAAIAVAVGVRCPAPPPTNQNAAAASSTAVGSPSRPPTAAAAPGSSAPLLAPLPGLSLHWGCCYGSGQRWHGPAPGWHTLPAVSYDAGKGAWQTPLVIRQAIPVEDEMDEQLRGRAMNGDAVSSRVGSNRGGCGAISPTATDAAGSGAEPYGPWIASYNALLQVPWEGPIRNGGICFVLKTARDQWIKARLPIPGGGGGGAGASSSSSSPGGGGGEADFWLPTSQLPMAGGGTPLLPDVFRMSHSDSLPQVFQHAVSPTANSHNGRDVDSANGHNMAAPALPAAGASAEATAAAAATAAVGAPPDSSPGLGATPASEPSSPQTLSPSPPSPPPPDAPSLQPPQPRAPTHPRSETPEAESSTDLLGLAAAFIAPPRLSDALLRPVDRYPLLAPVPAGSAASDGGGRVAVAGVDGVCEWMVEAIAKREPSAERSLMHRYNTGADLVDMAAGSREVAAALAALTAWLRLSNARLLVWNRNYNVKPREISEAQGRLAAALAALGAARGPSVAAAAAAGSGAGGSPVSSAASVGLLVRVALAAVGRGGAGEVGQRIRDEILAVQQRNGCKGGMMEEWHQKLHNNTSPDDVVICRALLEYIAAGLDITVYWRTLHAAGITAQRLASFDRAITSEPRFSGQQAAGLQRDLTAYLQTLQAVHGGDDLRSAVNNVLGYEEVDMKGKRIQVPPVPHVAGPPLARHLKALLALQQHLKSPQAAAAAEAAQQQQLQRQPPPKTMPYKAPHASSSPTALATSAVQTKAALHRPTELASLYGLAGAVRLMEMVVEARHLIKPYLEGGDAACGGRLVDVAFLDLALDSAFRTSLESNMAAVRQAVADGTQPYISAAVAATATAAPPSPRPGMAAASGGGAATVSTSAAAAAARSPGSGGVSGIASRLPQGAFAASTALGQALEVVRLAAENAALSSCPNDDLVYSNKWLRLLAAQEDPRDARDRMLQSLAICERIKRFLADQAAATMALLQPPAERLAERLGIQAGAVFTVGEEVVRGGSGAPLAQLLAALEPALRRATGGGVWQIVSRGADRPVLVGRLRVETHMAAVQHEIMTEPTVLLVEGITGAEEIPSGCVAVLVGPASGSGGGCPDVLSHSAVRARNLGVLLAGCHSPELVYKIKSHAGSRVMVRLEGQDVSVNFSSATPLAARQGDE